MNRYEPESLLDKKQRHRVEKSLITRDPQRSEISEQVAELENSLETIKQEVKRVTNGPARRLDFRSAVALGALALSIAGYVIQDARISSRQDAEIEMTKNRVNNLERIASATTEARIRTEIELKALREGQDEIKRLLEQHDSRTRGTARQQ
ncbi:MAG TPA: hypothetical protein VFB28_10015 [Terriglobales bacterium]|nr:hypothetical protein [Terriglobales bacterium]